ncbi:MAG: hypothetical protein ABIH00_01245 [Armatimonadota bacterium]
MPYIHDIQSSKGPKPSSVYNVEKLGTLKLRYLHNGIILLEGVTPSNIKLVYKRFGKGFKSGKTVLEPGYNHNGRPYMAVMSKRIWETKDFLKGMGDYYGSGQYWKDIVKTSHDINIADRGYNAVMDPVDKAFSVGVGKIKNEHIRCFLYTLYGYARTQVLISLLSICPHVAAVAGGFYLASFTCQIIFDFRGLVDFFKHASSEELCNFLGSLTAIGANVSGIKRTLKGKKVTISGNGKLKAENIKGDVKDTVAKDKGSNYVKKRKQRLRKFKEKRFVRMKTRKTPLKERGKIYGEIKKAIGNADKKTLMMHYREYLKTGNLRNYLDVKLKSMQPASQREFLDKFYSETNIINKKFETAYYARKYGHNDLAVKYYRDLVHHVADPALPKDFVRACWADIYYSMYHIRKSSVNFINDFALVKNAIGRMDAQSRMEIKRLLKDYYKMRDSQISF